MTKINQITSYSNNFNGVKFKAKSQEAEKSLLSTTTKSSDSFDLKKSKKSESFKDVFAEFKKNTPDSTSTIKEKEQAISYIDRMLACDDISNDLKAYWQNKKSVIQMEMQNIKNEEKTFISENVNDVWKEYDNFVKKYQKELSNSLSAEDKYEYIMTYNRTGLNFVGRLMKCSNITNQQMLEFKEMYNNFLIDMKNAELDFLNFQKENRS